MTFGVLGPVVVRRGCISLPVPRGKQRTVLAALLLKPNEAVSLEALCEALWWPDEPPRSALVTIQNYIRRLRHALGDTSHTLITTEPRGYAIKVDAGTLDASQFEELLKSAQAAARSSSWRAAARYAAAALALWRGEALADVESDMLTVREVPRLLELRLEAALVRIDAELRLGRHGEVTAELRRLTGIYPLHEHLHVLLMVALYQSGRRGDALAVYQQARAALIEHLGAEPGPALCDIHRRILAADPDLDW